MRRLYLQIYAAFIGIVVLFGVLSALTWWLTDDRPGGREWRDGIVYIAARLLPPSDASPDAVDRALQEIHDRFGVDVTLRAADGRPLAAVGRPLPALDPARARQGWVRDRHGWRLTLALPDGRRLAVRRDRPHGPRWLVIVGLLATAIAIGVYPLARRMTGRLERLRAGVEDLGAGDLATRVRVEGSDEVAHLAESFNAAADRIERLVTAQRSMLAGASHELRSPLARIRMAFELLTGDDRIELRQQVDHDIRELDELIDELLLASRLQSLDGLEHPEPVDMLAVAVEEGMRVGAVVTGAAATINGDPRMLRRLARNLFENARKHGGDTAIDATVTMTDDGQLRFVVADRGPGIPDAERERIFEPFYRPQGLRESRDPGVGLGLALVQQIARRHGGRAVCQPRADGGSEFIITLPIDVT